MNCPTGLSTGEVEFTTKIIFHKYSNNKIKQLVWFTFEYVNVVEDDLLEGHFLRQQIVVYQS